MTRDEILDIARDCGMWGQIEHHSSYVLFSELLQFTRRVQEWEREECLNCYSPDDTATDWADKIRARGQE